LDWVPPADGFDWIQLKSGEWLKGEIKAMQDRKLEVDSDKLNYLTFEWRDVRQGHRVITCGDATAALAVTENFDLLIVDFVLPNMNGRDLTAELRKRRPTLPVILMSGYLPSPDLAPPPPSAFMQKPMRSGVIVETVQKMLSP
jgi:CheY-like chemotaxis protein